MTAIEYPACLRVLLKVGFTDFGIMRSYGRTAT